MPGVLTTLFVSALAAATPDAPAAQPPPPAAASEPPATACPSPAQLASALDTLMPGLAPGAPAAAPLPLASGARLAVASSPEGDVRVELVDAQGEIVLHRVLPAPPRGHAPDCPALAETIALIVDRYLHDVGYEVPPLPAPAPPPPPPPLPVPSVVTAPPPPRAAPPTARWRLGLAAGARLGDAGGLDGDGDLVLGVDGAGAGPRWGARLSAGLAPAADTHWPAGSAALRRWPLRLGVYLGVPAGPGRLEPGLGVGADLYSVSATGPGTAGGVHAAPSGDLSLGYTAPLGGWLTVRLLSRAALAVPYTFRTLQDPHVWGTPRVYGEVGVELALAFR